MSSPHHLLESLCLYRIVSPVMYFTSEIIHKLWSKAHRILSKFSEVMNAAACALCMVLRFSRTISDDDFTDNAGRSSERVAGNLILEPITSSNGEKPATL